MAVTGGKVFIVTVELPLPFDWMKMIPIPIPIMTTAPMAVAAIIWNRFLFIPIL
jgi:hypothetical protein